MADAFVQDLSREQIHWIDQIMEILGPCNDLEDAVMKVHTLEVARQWYLKQQLEQRRQHNEAQSR